MSDQGPITAYPAQSIKPQDQTGGPGLDKNTDPYTEWSRLEFWYENNKPYLKEYEGRGLLQGKAALITGGALDGRLQYCLRGRAPMSVSCTCQKRKRMRSM